MDDWQNKLENLRLWDFVNLRTISAGLIGTIVGLWVYNPLLSIAAANIGIILIIAGEWYAREIYAHPMVDKTYLSVFIGVLITGGGISATSIAIIMTGSSQWLQPFAWIWCFGLTGGPMIHWQRRKKREQTDTTNKDVEALSKLLTKKKDDQ